MNSITTRQLYRRLRRAEQVVRTATAARLQAEEELHHSQLLVARLNDTMPCLVFLYDLEAQQLLYCNDLAESLLGYTATEMLQLGSRVLPRLLHPDDLVRVRQRFVECADLPNDAVLEAEYRVRHRDGSWKWVGFESSVLVRYPDGRAKQIVGCAEDITQRRATEEQLVRSQHFVERITNTVPQLIYIFDLPGQRNVYCNQHCTTVLGYTPEELLAMNSGLFAQLTTPGEQARLLEYHERVAQAADGEILTLDYFLYTRAGQKRWLRSRSTPFARDDKGQVRQLVGSAEDITSEKAAAEQCQETSRHLAEQNHLFRQVIDAVPHLIYLKDADGNYLLANQATATIYGLSVEELLSKAGHQLSAHPEEGERYRAQDREVLREGRERVQEESFTASDGSTLWFNSIKRPFIRTDGTQQVLGVDSNITELKKAQEALQAAKDAAEANARAKQEFLANMSHEIRTPMNGILGIAGLLQRTALDEQQNQYLSHIRHSAENLLVVINDVLAMTQLGAGKIHCEYIAFDLAEVVRTSCQALLLKAEEKQIELSFELPPSPDLTVAGDPYRLRQILLNLLSNAVKFTDKGRVLLRCRRLSTANESPLYEFTVTDTGIGIPAHQLEAVFDSFTQASASTAREYGGSGLGLSISRGLVELLGGKISVESTPGQGSTFHFALPFGASTTAPSCPAPAATPDYTSLGSRRVLVAEDNAVNQFLVGTMLRNWGLVVDTASTGPEALELFEQYLYDVVLMDIQMPGMDGVATTHFLRQHPDAHRAATPVIALTAHAMPGEAERYRAAGLNGYLSKPFKEPELFKIIAAVLVSPVAQAVPTVPLYDLSGIRRVAHGNEAFVQRLVEIFIQTTPPSVSKLEEHLAQKEWRELRDAAHHLKSSLDGLLVRALYAPIRDLELSTAKPEPARMQTLVTQMRQVTEQVIEQLQQEFSVV